MKDTNDKAKFGMNYTTSKKQIPITLVMMAALLALLYNPCLVIAFPTMSGHGPGSTNIFGSGHGPGSTNIFGSGHGPGSTNVLRSGHSSRPVQLGMAGNFVILSKTGITDVPASAIVGNVGTSPITGAALLLTCPEVAGNIYTVDAAGPACEVIDPALLTAAVSDMQTAYADAAGRTLPNATELGAGNIDAMTIKAGLYKWSSSLLVPTVVTLNGGPNDVWIFQIAGDLTVGDGAQVILSGGARAKNVFWQVAGQTTVGTTANFKGIILCQTLIALNTGAVLNGRALAQTAVTLQMNAVTRP